MTQTNGTHVIEPIEYFLRDIVCVDRLALYQRVIDVIKNNQKFSIIESLNSILVAPENDSAADLLDAIHTSMINHLKDIILEYDVVVEGADLAFLADILEILNILDVYDAHEYIVNTIQTTEGSLTYKLYQVMCIVKELDEEEFTQTVKMVSQSLLERIVATHNEELNRVEWEDEEAVVVPDLTLLRNVARSNRDLIVNRLISSGQVSNVLPVNILTGIAKKEFENIELLDPKSIARELVGVYLISGLKGDTLIDLIREEMPKLISDDNAISRVGVVLNAVYVEMTT